MGRVVPVCAFINCFSIYITCLLVGMYRIQIFEIRPEPDVAGYSNPEPEPEPNQNRTSGTSLLISSELSSIIGRVLSLIHI